MRGRQSAHTVKKQNVSPPLVFGPFEFFKGVGYCAAFLIGWVLERRFVGFSTDVPLGRRLTRAVLGLLGYYAVSLILASLVKGWLPGPAGTTLSCFLQVFCVVFLFPLCAQWMERRSRLNPSAD